MPPNTIYCVVLKTCAYISWLNSAVKFKFKHAPSSGLWTGTLLIYLELLATITSIRAPDEASKNIFEKGVDFLK